MGKKSNIIFLKTEKKTLNSTQDIALSRTLQKSFIFVTHFLPQETGSRESAQSYVFLSGFDTGTDDANKDNTETDVAAACDKDSASA